MPLPVMVAFSSTAGKRRGYAADTARKEEGFTDVKKDFSAM